MHAVVDAAERSPEKAKNVRPLTGNEAIARGAWEAGVKVAAAYPGTPSTEILETLADYPAEDLHAQWSTNEKVALDVAIGASFAGRRALAAMKHVGLNVAADAFMSITYIGVNGGLVLAVCDDPGIHSSQNEQDTRIYGDARQRADARAERRAGGARFHEARLRSVGAIRHAGDRAQHDAAVAYPQCGGARRSQSAAAARRSSRSRRRTS